MQNQSFSTKFSDIQLRNFDKNVQEGGNIWNIQVYSKLDMW